MGRRPPRNVDAPPTDPLKVIAEVLGEPADQMRNPANAEYRCPFKNSTCTKYNRTIEAPAPVCSIHRRRRSEERDDPPIAVCPVRFFEADIARDVVRECWTGNPPGNPVFVHEVGMQKFGKVDLVIADYDERGRSVRGFLPVELQAVDITGSVLPHYLALTNNKEVEPHDYGFNWANVRKRFISQLIAKGFFCHHWGTRIVAVVQTDLFEQFQAHAHVPAVRLVDSNIVFMLYQFVRYDSNERWRLRLERVVPTTHVNVMNAVLYEQPPNKSSFEKRILRRLAGR